MNPSRGAFLRQCLETILLAAVVVLLAGCDLYPAGLDPSCRNPTSYLCCADPPGGGDSCSCAVGDHLCIVCADYWGSGPCSQQRIQDHCHPSIGPSTQSRLCDAFYECSRGSQAIDCQPGGLVETCRVWENFTVLTGLQPPGANRSDEFDLTDYCPDPPSGARRSIHFVLGSDLAIQLESGQELGRWLQRGGSLAVQLAGRADRLGFDIVAFDEAGPSQRTAGWTVPSGTSPAIRGEARLEIVATLMASAGWREIGIVERRTDLSQGGQLSLELVPIRAREEDEALRSWLVRGGDLRLGVELGRRRVHVLTTPQMEHAARAAGTLWYGAVEFAVANRASGGEPLAALSVEGSGALFGRTVSEVMP